MSTTRRTILSGALAAPFLAQFAGTASSETSDPTWGTLSGGWGEIRWTPEAEAQLDQFNATMEPIAPATWVTDDGRNVGVRFPASSGTGDPSLSDVRNAHGQGQLEGGVRLQTSTGRFEFNQGRLELANQLFSGTCELNGVEYSGQSLMRCDVEQAHVLADPVPAGQPLTIRVVDVPVRLTEQSRDVITAALGSVVFDVDTVLGYASAEAVYTPPQP
jgi:hypothetical protein